MPNNRITKNQHIFPKSLIYNFLDSNKRVILMSAGYKTEESEEDNLFAYYLTQKLREVRSLNLMNFEIR